ncbi:unnamed protein product [Brassica napus]|uniref:(rape) hypothetical protein n=1 Tax=Brassica napus TaxID=3708 RepID=A0A816R903_BRANA|nr:unnamed protein product [Brassica napus]
MIVSTNKSKMVSAGDGSRLSQTPTFCFRRQEDGFPALRIIPLGPVRQQSTSPGRALPGLDRTQYRFGVQKRQGSFRMERKSNPDGNCHHRLVLPLGLPRPNQEQIFEITNV